MIAVSERRIDIKELAIPEFKSSSSVGFDPKREISAHEIKQFRLLLSKEDDTMRYVNFSGMLSFLFPDEVWNEKYSLASSMSEKVSGNFIKDATIFTADILLENMCFAKKLFPTFEPGQETYDMTENILKIHTGPNNYYGDFYRQFYFGHLLFPVLKDVIAIPELYKSEVAVDVESAKDEDWYSVAQTSSYLKILSPEILRDNPLSNNDWKSMKETLHNYAYSGNARDALEMAFNLYVLSSEKVVFTENGPQFVMPPQKHDLVQESKVPQRRRF